jgi:hypothetical protein
MEIETPSTTPTVNGPNDPDQAQAGSSNEVYLLKDPAKASTPSIPKDAAPADIRAFAQERQSGRASEAPRDPTVSFQPGTYPEYVLPDVESWVKTLRDRHILVLSTPAPQLAYALAKAVLLSPAFADCEKREVFSESYDFGVDQFVAAAAGTKPRVVAAYANYKVSLAFLESLPPDGPAFNRTVRALCEREVWLLIVTRAMYIEQIEGQDPTLTYCYFEVPVNFLRPRLRAAYPDEAEEMADNIRLQRERNLWPRSDESLLKIINDRIKENSLRQRVATLRDAIGNNTAHMFMEQETPVSAIRLLTFVPDGEQHLQRLYQWVMFVGTFFPEMPVREFSTVLRLLLPSQTVETPSTDKVVSAVAPKSLYDSWSLNEHAVLSLCKMHYEAEGRKLNAPVIQFVEPGLTNDIELVFQSEFYGHYSHALSVIEEKGLLVDPSPLIRARVVDLLAMRAVKEAEYTGSRYVIDAVSAYLQTRTGDVIADTPLDQFMHPIERLPEVIRSLLLSQLASLVLKVAEKKNTVVAQSGLSQLNSAGLSGSVFTVLRRGAELNAPVEVLAEAARILLSSDDFGLFAATLKRIRETICEPSQGSLLLQLLNMIPQHQASGLIRYLSFYALGGYRSDVKNNPLAVAIEDACPSVDELKPLASALLADDFTAGMDDGELWELFHRWLAPEVLHEDIALAFVPVAAAINTASHRLYRYLESDAAPPSHLWLVSLVLGDTFSAISNTETRKTLAGAVAAHLDRKGRRQLASLVHENADSISVAIRDLQDSSANYNRTEREIFSKLLQRWKKLRDSLRLVKLEIDGLQTS